MDQSSNTTLFFVVVTLFSNAYWTRKRYSEVGIATSVRLVFESQQGQKIFFSSRKYPDRFWGLPRFIFSGFYGTFWTVKRPG